MVQLHKRWFWYAGPVTRRLRAARRALALAAATLAVGLCASSIGLIRAAAQDRAHAARPIVILISIDGWRWDYLARLSPPTISRLAASGVRAERLVPVFPSKTFPNHYSIVTGLYPARHGIVSNTMVDPALPGRFSLSNREVQQDTRWWGGEPLWVTVERQGQIAATMFWPGSDEEIAGDRPTFYARFDGKLPNAARVDRLLEWLRQPEATRPTFLTVYFSAIDSVGHDDGPEAVELAQGAKDVDAAIGRLVAGVEALGLSARANYVIVSDHGMAALSRDRTIVLDDYLDVSTIDIVDISPILGVNPRRGSAEPVYQALRDKHPALHVYRRDELPLEYRLRAHPRLASVIGVADDGWHITTRAELARDNDRVVGGDHGYDPRNLSMHGLFIAAGPRFRQGVVVPPFENIHIYELLCRVLDVRPAPNDGDPGVTAGFLR